MASSSDYDDVRGELHDADSSLDGAYELTSALPCEEAVDTLIRRARNAIEQAIEMLDEKEAEEIEADTDYDDGLA